MNTTACVVVFDIKRRDFNHAGSFHDFALDDGFRHRQCRTALAKDVSQPVDPGSTVQKPLVVPELQSLADVLADRLSATFAP